MSEIGDKIQEKCMAFADRVIRLNDYLLEQASSRREDVRGKKEDYRNGKPLPSNTFLLTSRVPVHLQSVANLCNQLLRAGTSIGANNAEATNAISKQDFKSKSFIALKEARESLYWIDLLHRNGYLDDKQYASIYADCEELVKLLMILLLPSYIFSRRAATSSSAPIARKTSTRRRTDERASGEPNGLPLEQCRGAKEEERSSTPTASVKKPFTLRRWFVDGS